MITGKKSALKGFGLLLFATITIMVLVGCCYSGSGRAALIVAGIANTIINGYIIVKLYKKMEEKS